MTLLEPPMTPNDQAKRLEKITIAFAATVATAYIVLLVAAVALRIWPYNHSGQLLQIDFTVFWTAGHLALQGAPHVAYTPHLIHLAEEHTVGHTFPANLPWGYPPLFLCVAAVLACLPYAVSFVLWNCTTFVMFGATVAAIVKRPLFFFAATVAPWSLVCLYIGQDGLFSASLVGAVLLLLNRRPALCGLLLGLLTFKPQLGLLFPIVLAFGRHWRAMFWACIGTLAWTAFSVAVFGTGTLLDFFHDLVGATDGLLIKDGIGWYNFQSVYAFCRWLGAGGAMCWSVQAVAAIGCMGAMAVLWRSDTPFSLKAAGLAAAIPVVTPYVFVYDFSVLTVAIAFLWEHRRFAFVECIAIAFAFLITSFAWSSNPAAALAPLAICAVVGRRIVMDRRERSGSAAATEVGFADQIPASLAT
jgi:arabinofuranan 3-O-arabinosyltransferase